MQSQAPCPYACHRVCMQPELLYNTALCHYKGKQHTAALKNLADIIERGVREHPELSVGR